MGSKEVKLDRGTYLVYPMGKQEDTSIVGVSRRGRKMAFFSVFIVFSRIVQCGFEH